MCDYIMCVNHHVEECKKCKRTDICYSVIERNLGFCEMCSEDLVLCRKCNKTMGFEYFDYYEEMCFGCVRATNWYVNATCEGCNEYKNVKKIGNPVRYACIGCLINCNVTNITSGNSE